jgi:hypothetical protein
MENGKRRHRPLIPTRGGRFLAETLRRLGIRHLFSIPGAQVLSVWDRIRDVEDLDLVVPRSEWDAALMGEGYGKAGGRPAVVMNTLGPGVANESVGMDSARAGASPVLFVSPCQPPEKRQRLDAVFQGFDHRQFFDPIALATHTVDRPDELDDALRLALRQCTGSPAGPVRVDVSFPMLFERHRFRWSPPTPSGDEPDPSELTVVFEADPGGHIPSWLQPLEQKARVIWPGLCGSGFEIPYALGANYARRDAPTVVFTTPDRLLDNLDSVSVARHSRNLGRRTAKPVPLNLVARGGGGSQVREIQRAFGGVFVDHPTDQELCDLVLLDPKALWIVCSPDGHGP